MRSGGLFFREICKDVRENSHGKIRLSGPIFRCALRNTFRNSSEKKSEKGLISSGYLGVGKAK